MNVSDQNLCAARKKVCRMAAAHGSVVKTLKIDVLVTHVKPAKKNIMQNLKEKKCVFFSGFIGKVYARAEVKHTIYFERPYKVSPSLAQPSHS